MTNRIRIKRGKIEKETPKATEPEPKEEIDLSPIGSDPLSAAFRDISRVVNDPPWGRTRRGVFEGESGPPETERVRVEHIRNTMDRSLMVRIDVPAYRLELNIAYEAIIDYTHFDAPAMVEEQIRRHMRARMEAQIRQIMEDLRIERLHL